MSDTPNAPSLGDVVGAAAFVVGLITAWLYVAGWSYAYHYFDRFRIPMLLAEVPREHVFVYGALTVWKNPLMAAAIAAAGALLITACIQYRTRIGRSLLVGLMTLAVVGLFVLARLAGTETAAFDANHQRASDYAAYPRVVVDLPQDATTEEIINRVSSGCAKLVLATETRIFLIFARRSAPALELNTIVLPWDQVRSMTVSGQYASCD